MRTLWVVTLALVALTAEQGCKRKEPQPIPGPKAGLTVAVRVHTPGIAWFQGSLDEAFARPQDPKMCAQERDSLAPRASEVPRARNRPSPLPPAACRSQSCPPNYPHHPLV